MPNVTLHFYAANDLNGPVLHTITDEDDYLLDVELRVTGDELGSGSVRLSKHWGGALFDSDAFKPEAFCRVLVHAYSDTDYFWGFFLHKRDLRVVGEEGSEEFLIGGRGPKWYLDKGGLGIEQYTGTGWQIDLDAGVFSWRETATAGRILNRVVEEALANPVPGVPDLTKSFGAATDSLGNAWANDVSASDGDFELPIGHSILKSLWELEDLDELQSKIYLGTVADPVFRLDAAPNLGTDYSGTAYAADVLRFLEATPANPEGNIGAEGGGAELTVEGNGPRKASHAVVKGKDGVWATAERPGWNPGDPVKWVTVEYSRSNKETTLEKAGIRFLKRQENRLNEIHIPIIPGTDPLEGGYFPEPDGMLWPFNIGTVYTGGVSASPFDYRNDDYPITGIKLKLLPASRFDDALKRARSWDIEVQLNTERGGATSPSQGTTGGHTPGPCCGPRQPEGPSGGEACTRLYFSTTAAAISPLAADASWADDASKTVRRLKTAPDDSIPSGSGSSDFIVGVNIAAGSYVRDDDISAFQITDAALLASVQAGGLTARMQMLTRSRHGIGINEGLQDHYPTWLARVYRAGTGFIGTLWGLTGGGTRFLPQSTMVNRTWAATAAAVAGAALNDWIVIEIGARHVGPTSGGMGAYHRLQSVTTTADLPENETETAALNPWIELCTGGSVNPGDAPLTTVRQGQGTWGESTHYVPVGSTIELGLLSDDGQHYLNASDIQYGDTDVDSALTSLEEDLTALQTEVANPTQVWEAVTDGEDVFVWDDDDLVHEWRAI